MDEPAKEPAMKDSGPLGARTATSTQDTAIVYRSVLAHLSFALWVMVSFNSVMDPVKTLYGYYMYMDSYNQYVVWQLTVANTFNNQSSRVCSPSGPFRDCYFELPVFGTGSLAGATCRSYYPIDKGDTQHVGNFFGNCTLPGGDVVRIPDPRRYASTQWSVQTSSANKPCLDVLGEGDSFACDSYTTMNGRVINHRASQTETTKWCKEFGGFYILDYATGVQQVLIANVSDSRAPVFTSIAMTYLPPVFSLEPLIGCAADLHVGGTATHITTSAWYGDTTAPWTARTTRTADSNTLSSNGSVIRVSTLHYSEGDLTQVRLGYKDAFRLSLLAIITFYRCSSIYYPIALVYWRQRRPLVEWLLHRHMGLVLHKRERHNIFLLLLLSAEAIASTEDIIMYCQQVIYSGPSLWLLMIKYMSITRIIWPCAFLLLLVSRFVQFVFGAKHAFAMSEDLFFVGAPVVWAYIPIQVTSKGMDLFQGYRWTGAVVRHYTNSIFNVYSKQLNCFNLYVQLFGAFSIVSPFTTIAIDFVWRRLTNTSSILVYVLSPLRHGNSKRVLDISVADVRVHNVLMQSTRQVPPEIAYQMTRAKLPQNRYCESLNLAAEGFVCLVYGSIHVVGIVEWGVGRPLENELGHIAVIENHHVSFRADTSIEKLARITSHCAKLTLRRQYPSFLQALRFVMWLTLTLNSLLDPIKTFTGYFTSLDSSNQGYRWQLTVANTFNNQSSRVCSPSGPFRDCYFELPVFGTGSLAGATCRSYYPIDKGDTQHVGNYFGNCTLPGGDVVYIPDPRRYASTQWSVQTSSVDRSCLAFLGEGDSFACDSYTTMNGRIINYRASHTETTKWCKEFGGFYILDYATGVQQVLIANVSDPQAPVFTSIALELNKPVFNLHSLTGCQADMRIGGTATQVTTSAWYGDTAGPWTARTTRTADNNEISFDGTSFVVSTLHKSEGDISMVRTVYKDASRLAILGIVIFYRVSSVYYPIFLAFRRHRQPLLTWLWRRHLGLVLHKRERHNALLLFLLSIEAIASTEDIVVYCQHAVYSDGASYGALLLDYMSIMRIIWPSALVLLCISRFLGLTFGVNYSFAMSENLFILGAPVVWIYVPTYVTTRGMSLFQGYRWTGTIVHHYTNSIFNVYTNQVNCFDLYVQLFGIFTLLSPATVVLLSTLWKAVMPSSSIAGYLLAPPSTRPNGTIPTVTVRTVLQASTFRYPPAIAHQVTRAKLPRTHLCEAVNLAADGLVCLVYGPHVVLGITEWGLTFPVESEDGHAAIIQGHAVAFDPRVTVLDLARITANPVVLGIPDLT
ncbi:hypothetical protein ACHHYP_10996 [Achlya hypogyna]|uniref:Transmembrane protein n=1 Tax=Achlya hypogyna TaxID=1202772 RepID=A0A1V9YK36_ACHHY|nr:hypothetical protein ACHHYP_10996 [Achlya hypogyna]